MKRILLILIGVWRAGAYGHHKVAYWFTRLLFVMFPAQLPRRRVKVKERYVMALQEMGIRNGHRLFSLWVVTGSWSDEILRILRRHAAGFALREVRHYYDLRQIQVDYGRRNVNYRWFLSGFILLTISCLLLTATLFLFNKRN